MNELKVMIIKEGSYTTCGVVQKISIIKQNWDHYYEPAYDDGEPVIDKDGFAYYVIYGDYDDLLYANRSKTCITLDEAFDLAINSTDYEIIWKEGLLPK